MGLALEASVVRIVTSEGAICGTGFVVAPGLVVTCAHVVRLAQSSPRQPIHVQRFAGGPTFIGQVHTEGWSPAKPEEAAAEPTRLEDVAFLQAPLDPEECPPVVLGFAQPSGGHAYHAVGFAKLAGYEVRHARDQIEGRVPAPLGSARAPMLMLGGRDIERGMSGAPVFDEASQRVVGMVSEFFDGNAYRYAWATTSDTLQALYPALSLWPESYGPEEQAAYLEEVIEQTRWLRLPERGQVELERLYVSLRADEMHPYERLKEKEALFQHQIPQHLPPRARDHPDSYTYAAAVQRALVRWPIMRLQEAHAWDRLFDERSEQHLSLAEVLARHPNVVLLGDPGMGKTTLCHWLVLHMARAFQQGLTRVHVRADQVQSAQKEEKPLDRFLPDWLALPHSKVQPASVDEEPLDLGVVRLPILVRVAEFARARFDRDRGNPDLRLEMFLQHGLIAQRHSPAPSSPRSQAIQALLREALQAGRALLVLDGLDEVADIEQREQVMDEIEHLLAQWPSAQMADAPTGNRVVVTSRLVGYRFRPLKDWPHYVVEEMEETAITAFCQAWMRQREQIDANAAGLQLKQALFDQAHPGVRVLAGNPLLLTILADVYQAEGTGALPGHRVELFDKATRAFYRRGRDRWNAATITLEQLVQALGEVALTFQDKAITGLAEAGLVDEALRRVLALDQVQTVLEAAKDGAGLLVERGGGVYSFLHRSIQEYFVAQALVADPAQAAARLTEHALDPTWREPVILGLGLLSQRASARRLHEAIAALLETPDPLGAILPQRELLVTVACADCVQLPTLVIPVVRQAIERLLENYTTHLERKAGPVLLRRIEHALSSLRSSPAKQVGEAMLCAWLEDPRRSARLAGIAVLEGSAWATPALARALVASWRRYPGPAASLLHALEWLYEHAPTAFSPEFLPLRQELLRQPQLLERIQDSQNWEALIRILYLPVGAGLDPNHIIRDSPLTEPLLDLMHQSEGPDQEQRLYQTLQDALTPPDTALARDAALAMTALGQQGWMDRFFSQPETRLETVQPILASHAVLSASTVARARARARALERALERALDSARALASARARTSDLASALASARANALARALDGAGARANALESDLSRALDSARAHVLDLANELNREGASALASALDVANDVARARALDSARESDLDRDVVLVLARTLARFLDSASALDSTRALEQEIKAWHTSPHLPLELAKYLAEAHTAAKQIRFILQQGQALDSSLRTLLGTSVKSRSEPPELSSPADPGRQASDLPVQSLTLAIEHLTNLDDQARSRARQVLLEQRLASQVGKEAIEHLAALANRFQKHPQVGTFCVLALHAIEHDRADWLLEWIQLAGTRDAPTTARKILESMHTMTPVVWSAVQRKLRHAAPWVQEALLVSLSWQARLGNVPDDQGKTILSFLLGWLDQEEQARVRMALVEACGQWPAQEARIGHWLLKLEARFQTLEEWAVYLSALARLASRAKSLQGPIEALLQRTDTSDAAQAAQVRLLVTRLEAPKQYAPLQAMLEQRLPDKTRLLEALLEAGKDDDPWNDHYHGVLVQLARAQVEQNPEHLLAVLLARFQAALDGQEWTARRITLAAVAACAEVLPTALAAAAHGHLEAWLIQGTLDAESFTSRRFALTALSYLRAVTPAVLSALLVGCQDMEEVQRDAIAAANRFQVLEGELPVDSLREALTGPSDITAAAVAQLLAALATSAAGEHASLRTQISALLLEVLKHLGVKRQVTLPETPGMPHQDTLEDVLYSALLNVIGWTG